MTKDSMNEIPAYVDDVLREWVTIAFTSYDGYERFGRGVVGISLADGKTELLYGERAFFCRAGDDAIAQLIDAYDPTLEFLVVFDTPQGQTRTLRIRTPDGKRHPKRIWFFEMLRRVNEESESLPEGLPAWFVDALDKLEKAKKPDDPLLKSVNGEAEKHYGGNGQGSFDKF